MVPNNFTSVQERTKTCENEKKNKVVSPMRRSKRDKEIVVPPNTIGVVKKRIEELDLQQSTSGQGAWQPQQSSPSAPSKTAPTSATVCRPDSPMMMEDNLQQLGEQQNSTTWDNVARGSADSEKSGEGPHIDRDEKHPNSDSDEGDHDSGVGEEGSDISTVSGSIGTSAYSATPQDKIMDPSDTDKVTEASPIQKKCEPAASLQIQKEKGEPKLSSPPDILRVVDAGFNLEDDDIGKVNEISSVEEDVMMSVEHSGHIARTAGADNRTCQRLSSLPSPLPSHQIRAIHNSIMERKRVTFDVPMGDASIVSGEMKAELEGRMNSIRDPTQERTANDNAAALSDIQFQMIEEQPNGQYPEEVNRDQPAGKQSRECCPDGTEIEVGAVQVNEQAPSLNRLNFRRASQLARTASRRARRRREREDNCDATTADEQTPPIRTLESRDGGEVPNASARTTLRSSTESFFGQGRRRSVGSSTWRRRASFFLRRTGLTNLRLVEATLVEANDDVELVVAEPMSLVERKWKVFACATCSFILLFLAISFLLMNSLHNKRHHQPMIEGAAGIAMVPSVAPSMQPSLSLLPNHDHRPTLEVIRAKGHVRCGLDTSTGPLYYAKNMCRAVASVLFGNPHENFIFLPATMETRFQGLVDRDFDLVIWGITHTMRREIKESFSGSGFTFSSTYTYDGLSYFGNQTFVTCAEEQKRHNECSSLLICVVDLTTHVGFVQSSFPSEFVVVVDVGDFGESLVESLYNGTCNVIAADRSFLWRRVAPQDQARAGEYILGDRIFTKEPLSIVTRNDDREFSDIVNWALHALFYGEEQNIGKNLSLCQSYTDLTSRAAELDFMRAVYCVGNYSNIFYNNTQNRGVNRINNGTGMLYTIPFGDLENLDGDPVEWGPTPNSTFSKIMEKGSLNCGVIVPNGYIGPVSELRMLSGMSVDFCHALSAALFNGNHEAVTFSMFLEADDDSFVSLSNGTIDILAGRRIEKQYDFDSSPNLVGFQFSKPYYYGNETAGNAVSFFSLVTREDDELFSSFVDCVVMATFFAQENGITKKKSKEMPLVSIFGRDLRWALRDVVKFTGGYDQLYAKSFGQVSEEERGRNKLAGDSGPLLLSFPGL
eukprot:CAMPEP_0183743076 /NCGR_PEP_ID=MMETSP0737-20130205/65031_1 /TAXON_ID=385413 /ORGANISM="Thalassiosira miniscula, Strain CCMP1093" /LENGTH=1112 /DNA_ID=CAMNT_0025978681 /DNA_START=259 /DNA_END=3597 /DNA_ORIENTATION=-